MPMLINRKTNQAIGFIIGRVGNRLYVDIGDMVEEIKVIVFAENKHKIERIA